MTMKRIHDSLERVFEKHRLVFWYDATGEWKETFDAFAAPDVKKLDVLKNEFGTKVRIVRDPNPTARFLVYIPEPRPRDEENWLLDLLVQGFEYKADKASLALQEVGLPQEFRHLAEEHAAFFQKDEHMQKLRVALDKHDLAREIRLKMMGILAGTPADVDALLLHFLGANLKEPLLDAAAQCLETSGLRAPFWREVERRFGYTAELPTIRDFAVTLFRAANPLDDKVREHAHAKVFIQRWKDSLAAQESFRTWAQQLEKELQIETALNGLEERGTLGEADTFEIFEKFTLQRLCKAFERGVSAHELRAVIQQRRTSFWQREHKFGYAALEHAVELRELLAAAELSMDSLNAGFQRYTTSWWKIDRAYRACVWNLREYGQVNVMKQISQWVENAYVNNFLLPLADRWGDQVRRADTWTCDGVVPQRFFFDKYVQPFREKGQKVFVIISDALRYEVAMDFAGRLLSANRWSAEVDALFGSLPSYTQLGMASLLPGRERVVDAAKDATVVLEGRSTAGIDNRDTILRAECAGRATAMLAEKFLDLNTKTEGRALMRDHDVIYIFHNHIDKVGDSASTEARTFEAVEETFTELEQIIKKVANINGTNMLLTSDHGFLFQQDAVDDDDMTPLPTAKTWMHQTRRFALGKGIVATAKVKVFTSTALGVSGDFSAAFPLSLGRFPQKGSGKRFVHGGISLQEVTVPVVKIHKARTDDTERVDVELIRVPAKITTGQVAIAFYQEKPAVGKTLPRTLRVGVYAKNGTSLSEIKTQVFDSKETEDRQRETTMILVLSSAADAYNNTEVELRLEDTVPGTNQLVEYKKHGIKLQKPFASDFDDE